jgi:hypothetical protein
MGESDGVPVGDTVGEFVGETVGEAVGAPVGKTVVSILAHTYSSMLHKVRMEAWCQESIHGCLSPITEVGESEFHVLVFISL